MNGANRSFRLSVFGLLLLAALMAAGCGGMGGREGAAPSGVNGGAAERAPALEAVALGEGEKLRAVATTNIAGDVVRAVGGDRIELTVLMPAGVDPHSYQATPADLRALAGAHVIFANGLGLEEAVLPVLGGLENGAPLIPVNAGVETLELGENGEGAEEHAGGEHGHGGVDPHTWWDVRNVERWAENVTEALSTLDPANEGEYEERGAAYRAALAALDAEIREEIAGLPAERRKLVTDHDNIGYFAAAYGFEVVGAAIPSLSTMAAPSARERAALQDRIRDAGVRAIFVGSTVNPAVQAQLGEDLGVEVARLYTDSLSDAQGPASSYLEFMRYNVRTIVEALK